MLRPKASEGKAYAEAYGIFRAAYFFSAIVLAVPFILNLAFLWMRAA